MDQEKPDREKIDKVRQLLLKSFMAEDMALYAKCVFDLECLIGVEHGDRNPKDTSKYRTAETKKRTAAEARQLRWAGRTAGKDFTVDVEDGVVAWTIRHKS